MGMDISSKLIVGYEYSQLEAWADEKDVDIDELVEDMDYASPYYDAPCEEMIYGIEISGGNGEVTDAALGSVDEAKVELHAKFGVEPKLYVSAHVC